MAGAAADMRDETARLIRHHRPRRRRTKTIAGAPSGFTFAGILVEEHTMSRFFHATLRTLDVEGARAFYAAVFGRTDFDIVQLHEHAIARGARPHWLGYLDVDDVDRAAATLVERGAVRLGRWVHHAGLEVAVLRDSGGAIVAVAEPPARAGDQETARAPFSSADVVWHELNTVDVERAKANYGDLFGWEFAPPIDLGNLGVIHPFAWEPGAAPVGSMSDIAGRPGVHPQWLFHRRTASLGAAMDAVRAGGGHVLGPLELPQGERIAICDDPQGAAFAIRDRVASTSSP